MLLKLKGKGEKIKVSFSLLLLKSSRFNKT